MWLSPSGQVAHTTLDWRLCRTRIFTKGAMNFKKLKIFAEALDVTIDDLLDKENLKRGASIQKKYDQLNPVHQNIINETIDAYLCKENKGTIIS